MHWERRQLTWPHHKLAPWHKELEKWERTLCENKAVAILAEMQAGRPALIQKDGGEMLIAIVLDRPLTEAKALENDPTAFTREMTRILVAEQGHPLIAQMMRPTGSSDPPPANSTASGTGSHERANASQPVQLALFSQRGVPTVATRHSIPLLTQVLIGAVTMGYPWLTLL